MKARKLICALSAFFFCIPLSLPFALAGDPETETLKKEVQELKSTVNDLKGLVERQNQRIEDLSGEKGVKKSAPKEEKKIVEEKAAPLPTPPPVAEAPSPSAPPQTRYLGPYKYTTPASGAWKLLPDISVIGVFAGAYFTEDPGPRGHDPSRTGFNLQEIEVAFQSVIDPYVRADVFLSFHEDGVELEEGYITTLALPKGFQIKGGKYLVPFGRQNSKHLELWPFVNNNLPNRTFLGDEGFNELGVEFSYLFPTPFFLQAQFSFNQGDNEGNFDGARKQDFAYTGRLVGSTDLTGNLTLLAGASAAFGWNATGQGNATNLFGGDLLLKWKPSQYQGIEWQTEYLFRRREVPLDLENEGGIASYILGNWTKRWGAGLRAEYIGIPAETDKVFRLSPMVAFRTTEFFRLRAQYDLIRTLGDSTEHAAYLQMIFNMGPHGAHQF